LFTTPRSRQIIPPCRFWFPELSFVTVMGVSIAIEGPEGAGKSLLSLLVKLHLEETIDLPFIITREPGSSALGEQIRQMLKTDIYKDLHPATSALLFNASRAELFYKVEQPFLRDNPKGILVKDRCWLSTEALQVAEGGDRTFITNLTSPFKSIPDKFAIIDIPVLETVVRMEAAFTYSSEREIDWRDEQKQEVLFEIRKNYLDFAVQNPDKCIVLDCFDDPWVKAGRIKFEAIKTLAEQEGKIIDNREGQELLLRFQQEAKKIMDEDTERKVLRIFDIEGLRRNVEKTRIKLNFPVRDELRKKMHEEWGALGLEGTQNLNRLERK